MRIEFCISSIEGAIAAQKWRADRVELCRCLSEDGLTPGRKLIKKSKESYSGDIHVMIRPVEGAFVASKQVLYKMKDEISMAYHMNVKGVVFGVLDSENKIDIPANKLLFEYANLLGLKTTFHRAFDLVPDPFQAMENIISIGFHRILTSGANPMVINGMDVLKEMVNRANKRIEIMAGGGVNHVNILELQRVNVDAVHFSIHNKEKGEDVIEDSKIAKILRNIRGV